MSLPGSIQGDVGYNYWVVDYQYCELLWAMVVAEQIGRSGNVHSGIIRNLHRILLQKGLLEYSISAW